MRQLKILLLSANPDGSRIGVDEEHREIRARVRASSLSDRIDLEPAPEVRISELTTVLQQCAPDVVHFSGHGSEDGELILNEAAGRSVTARIDAVIEVFAALSRDLPIRCVLLNACYTARLAEGLRRHVDCVIGVPDELDVSTSIAFAGAFYEGICFGRDLQSAFQLGLAQVHLVISDQGSEPRMFCRDGVRPEELRLFEAPAPVRARVDATAGHRGPDAHVAAEPSGALPSGLFAGAESGVYQWDGGRSLGVEMVRVPAGTTTIGDLKVLCGPVQRELTFARDFFVARYPVTVGEFTRFVRETSYKTYAERERYPETWKSPGFASTGPDRHPVVCVSHEDAMKYAEWAGLALPDEWQWEYAARGPDGRRFPWGDDPPTDKHLHWSKGRAVTGTSPVGTHASGRSWCGAHDVVGNAWEWTSSEWANVPFSTDQDLGLSRVDSQVVRGCGWTTAMEAWAWPVYRSRVSGMSTRNDRGFRCMVPVEE